MLRLRCARKRNPVEPTNRRPNRFLRRPVPFRFASPLQRLNPANPTSVGLRGMLPLPTRRTGSLGPVNSAIHRMRTPPSRLQLRPSNRSTRRPQSSRLPLASESPPAIDQSRRLRMELRLLHQYRPTRRGRKSARPSLSHWPLGQIPLANRDSIKRST